MAIEVRMPKLGMTMTEGKIVRWMKKEGEFAAAGEALYTVENAKVNIDVEAPEEGTLIKIFAEEGETVPVGQVVAYLGNAGEKIRADQPADSQTAESEALPEPESLCGEEEEKNIVRATPAARALAKKQGIDMKLITGSGIDGRIKRVDVQQYGQKGVEQTACRDVCQAACEVEPAYVDMVPSSIRAAGAQRMAASFTQVPHFYLSTQVDVSKLQQLLRQARGRAGEGTVRPTFTDVLAWFTARVIKEHPLVNSQWIKGGKIRQFTNVNFGIAADTPEGLVVPVIRNADSIGFSQITAERSRLVHAARNQSLTAEDLSDGTFTLSNLGMFDIDVFQGILNAPQAALLTVGAVNSVLKKEGGRIVEQPIMKLCLSCDHRVLDGAAGARFLKRLKAVMEEPMKLLDQNLF